MKLRVDVKALIIQMACTFGILLMVDDKGINTLAVGFLLVVLSLSNYFEGHKRGREMADDLMDAIRELNDTLDKGREDINK